MPEGDIPGHDWYAEAQKSLIKDSLDAGIEARRRWLFAKALDTIDVQNARILQLEEEIRLRSK